MKVFKEVFGPTKCRIDLWSAVCLYNCSYDKTPPR